MAEAATTAPAEAASPAPAAEAAAGSEAAAPAAAPAPAPEAAEGEPAKDAVAPLLAELRVELLGCVWSSVQLVQNLDRSPAGETP